MTKKKMSIASVFGLSLELMINRSIVRKDRFNGHELFVALNKFIMTSQKIKHHSSIYNPSKRK